jgi:hypothetical protein
MSTISIGMFSEGSRGKLTGVWKTLVEPCRLHVRHGCVRGLRSICGSTNFILGRFFLLRDQPRNGSPFSLAMCCVAFLLLSMEPLLSQTTPPAETDVIEQILSCLETGQEAVLRQREPVKCAPFGEGVKLLKRLLQEKSPDALIPDAPINVNIASACEDSADLRRLPSNAVKLLAKQSKRINPIGIRVIGAIFCEKLGVIGLDIPYSLVLDKSIFVHGIMARSFRTHGDLSFDNSLIFEELFLARAHVDGTIFASGSLIWKMRLLDSEVHGSWLLRNSLVLDLAAFDTVQLSGELSVRNSFFSYLLVQFSKIGGVLDLTGSQARCSYKIRKSEIGDIVAVDSGFGTVETPSQETGNGKPMHDWNNPGPEISALLTAAGNRPGSQICDRSSISYAPGSFLISDTRIKSSLCLRSFHWLEGIQAPISYVTFDDVNVGTATSIDLTRPGLKPEASTNKNRKLELMGFETGSLFLSFSNSENALSLSGLKFEHVYASDVACDYDPDFSNTDTEKAATERTGVRSLGNDADPGASSRLPRVEEVMGWLSENSLATTQPFAAFVDVFQKHGEDNDAKALRIAKADAELCLRARRVMGEWICGKRKEAGPGSQVSATSPIAIVPQTATASQTVTLQLNGSSSRSNWWNHLVSVLRSWIDWGNEFASVALGAVLWLIADNGYHPEKVGWFVVLSIVAFGIYFWLGLKVVGLLPKGKHIILPVGIVFLFDRLLPAYQIREDHYNVASFFKLVPRNMKKHLGGELKTMRYLGRDFRVVPTNEVERLRIERSLDVLKVIGLILAVFLVAAINAIVSH